MVEHTRQKRPMVRPRRSSGTWLSGAAWGIRYMPCSLARRQQLGAREEESLLDDGVLGRVAAVDGVALDGGAIELADRPLLGLGYVRGTHHLAEMGDGILALQSHRDHWPAGHELHQAAIERPLLVHLVERLGLRLREPQDLEP